jgi:flagellar basal-body rod protein FlgG
MIRALYTAATGMQAQQLHIDVIANNLANVNTTGFKKSRADFQDLLYQTLTAPGAPSTANTQLPTGIQVGLGVRPAAVQRINTQGDYTQTGNRLDLAIEGTGFFQVVLADGSTAFTRAGAFKLDNQSRLVTSDGMPLEPTIAIPDGAEDITIGQDGVVSALLPGQGTPTQVGQIQTTRFANPAGLRALGKNLLQETETSGPPQPGTPGDTNRGTLLQGYLENSNVSVVEELVALIAGQRAYEVTSRAIQTADEMLRATNAIVS